MTLKSLTLAGAALLATPAFGQTRPAPVAELVREVDIPFEQFTLPNGLRVVVHTDRKAPVVAVSMWYDVGSKHEPKGKTGFAHLFEHLMFNGSENAPGEFFEPLQSVGATDYNGTTSYDRTNYFETVPTAALERALFLESDRMGWLLGAITPAVVDEQRGVVQNEKRQGDTQPYGLIRYKLPGSLFPEGHPYHHTTIGSMADLDRASVADVKSWFRDHYGPNNAVLVLAGDVDVATARTLVARYFGPIKAGPKSVLPDAPVTALPAPVREVMHDRVAQTLIVRSWAVPGLNDPDAAGLTVAASVIGGLASSRLDNALVRREKLAVSVSAGNGGYAQVGTFTIQATVRPGVEPAAVEKRLDEIVAEFLERGPTADEVNRVVTSAVAGRIAGLESVGGFGGKAVALAEGALYSNDPGFYKKRLQRLAAQTPASVRAVANKWLTRPVYQLSVVPGTRDAYGEAAVPPAVPVAAAPEVPPKGTRGGLPAVGEVANLSFPAVTRTRLRNGIEVVYAQRTAVPVTNAILSFDAGVAADVEGRLGTAGLTMAMLDEGTAGLDSTQLAEARERLGAGIGAGSSLDRSFVSLGVPSANLLPALDLWADVVRNPAFREDDLARVRNQALAGISQELTSPQGLAGRVLPPLLQGPASPYAKAQGGGDPRAVAALTRADLLAWRERWLRPDKAKIFVVSDRPLAEVQAALEQRFGDWRATGEGGTKAFDGAARPAGSRIVLVDRPDSPQSLIQGGLPTGLKGTDDLLPLLAGNDALGGSFLSRFNLDLREAKHWAYGAGGGFSRAEFNAPYIVSASVQADKTGPSLAALRQDMADFVTTRPLTKAEFDRSVTGSIRSLSGGFETGGAVLGAMQANDLYRRPDNYYATVADRYRALTREGVATAVGRVIDPARLVWVVVGDAKVVRPQLDSLGLDVEVVPAAAVAGGAQPPAAPAAK